MRQMPLNACTSEQCVNLQTQSRLLLMAARLHVYASSLNLRLLIHTMQGMARLAVAAGHKHCPYTCPVVLRIY